MDEALTSMTDRVPNLDLKFFVTSVILQRQTGGDLAEIQAHTHGHEEQPQQQPLEGLDGVFDLPAVLGLGQQNPRDHKLPHQHPPPISRLLLKNLS